jgi:hypothetical protein
MTHMLSADTARCAGTHRNECNQCMRRLSPSHERQVWMGPWVMEDEPCPYRIPTSMTRPSAASASPDG